MNLNDSSLSQRLRAATQTVHRVAEQSGMMQRMLQGQISQAEYALMLRNLHALYATLERALERHASLPALAPLRMPVLYRTAALASDLEQHHGPAWDALPLTLAIRGYVSRLEQLSDTAPALLAAHAYVRYLGDLSGGQMLSRIVGKTFGLSEPAGTAFYEFGEPRQVASLKEQFRTALDHLPLDPALIGAVVEEAGSAFERHLALFTELDQAARSAA